VTIGSRRPGEVEITAGLEAGEFVVIHGALRARHDQEVKIIAVATGDETLEELLQQGIGGPTK
jgi:membrane fusion protein (multidrug efflux system)